MQNILKVLKLAKPFHKLIYLLSFIILLATLLGLATPYVIKLIVDQIELQLTSGAGDIQRLYVLVAVLFAVSVLAIVFEGINQRLGDYTRSRIGKFLTETFYRKVFTLPQGYFDSQVSGKIVNQLNRGINSLQDFFGDSSNFIVPALIRSAIIIVVLAFYNPLISLLVFLIFPFYIYISSYATKKWGEREMVKNQIDDSTRGRIQEVINNIRLVKSYNTQNKEWSFVSTNLKSSIAIYDKQSTTYHILNFFRNFGLEIGLIVISVIVFANTFNGLLTIGEMVLILQYLFQVRWPLFAMSYILEQVQRAEVGSKEYFEILDLESVEQPADTLAEPRFPRPTITFTDVSFEYAEGGLVLKDVNFSLLEKETVALVGHSGSGKTTLINLILKLYSPSSGKVTISDTDYEEMTHAEVRSHIALVFQENELFSTTVFENVAYGKPDATEEEVLEAIKKANAEDFVMKLPEGLYAEIGERGVKLSGGQKQRIQIARAILANKPILILDEATSSLDAKSEKLVQDALEELMKDKLVIIIAHRFSTIQSADRILVLDDGKIVDSGVPGDLAKKDGIYSELLRYQIEGNQKLLEKYDLRLQE